MKRKEKKRKECSEIEKIKSNEKTMQLSSDAYEIQAKLRRVTFGSRGFAHTNKKMCSTSLRLSLKSPNTKGLASVGLRLAAEIRSISRGPQPNAGDGRLHKRMNCCSLSILCPLYSLHAAGHASHASAVGRITSPSKTSQPERPGFRLTLHQHV